MASIAGLESALFGIRENLKQFERTAERISRQAPGGDRAGDMVGLITSKAGVQANVKVARTADELIGTLLDILA